jgi:tetratricopeptide (TPR) repeat protein
MLDRATQNELRGLDDAVKEFVAGHLVMAGRHLEDDPALALNHAMAAASKASRLAVVREACGIAAYAAGAWDQAIRELRTAMRISGTVDFLPLIADCERGLGRPERALEIAGSREVSRLTQAGRVELRIVAAGARADLGQVDAALVTLKCVELQDSTVREWSVSLWYAYADMLERAGRTQEAIEWFTKAANADDDEETDAGERLHALIG